MSDNFRFAPVFDRHGDFEVEINDRPERSSSSHPTHHPPPHPSHMELSHENPMTENIAIENNVRIEPIPNAFGRFKVIVSENNYTIDVGCIFHMHKEIITCLAKHAVRLKKNIEFISQPDIPSHDILDKDTIYIARYYSEYPKTSTSKRIDLGNDYSIDLPKLSIEIGRNLYMWQQPTLEQGMGIAIKDNKSLTIAYMSSKYGVICLLWNGLTLLETPHDTVTKYIDYILCHYTAEFDKMQIEANKKLEQKRAEKRRQDYIHFLDNMFQNSLAQIDHRIGDLQRDVDAHVRGLNSKSRDIEKEYTFMQDVKNKRGSDKFKTQLENDYKLLENMRKAGKYVSYRFETQALVGLTPNIKLFGKYDIGRFEVKLFLDGRIKCNNLNGRVDNDTHDHPHISHGDPCWGNLNQSVINLMRETQFGVVLDLMFEFLNHYNDGKGNATNKPYILLEEGWPRFATQGILKICEHCHRIKELCRCGEAGARVVCRFCEEVLEDCDCARCPITSPPRNVVGEDIACAGCDHWDSNDEVCVY